MDPHPERQVYNRGLDLQQAHLPDNPSGPSTMFDLRNPTCFDDDKILYPPRNSVEFFVPHNKIIEKVNPDSVAASLAKDHPGYTSKQVGELSTTISRSYPRVYAVLVYIGKSADITIFMEAEVGDLKLPVFVSSDHRRLKYTTQTNRRAPLALTPLWKQRDVEDFFRYQFAFISPFFARPTDGSLLHYRLSHNDVLPIIEESDWIPDQPLYLEQIMFPSAQSSPGSGTDLQDISSSGSSPDQQSLSPARDAPFTVKQIRLHKGHYDFGNHGVSFTPAFTSDIH